MTTEEKCENCRYYKIRKLANGNTSGVCCRYPPSDTIQTHEVFGQYIDACFPEVGVGSWCGEFKEKNV